MNPELSSMLQHNIDLVFVAQIFVAFVCGGLVGLERQIHNKPSGIRTSILITIGAMIFVKYSIIVITTVHVGNPDPSRVIGQVVTGIGFLGAGTIMNKQGLVMGLTTAATIWAQAAIGAVIALGYLVDALIFSVVLIIVLNILGRLELMFNLAELRLKRKRFRPGVAPAPDHKHDKHNSAEED